MTYYAVGFDPNIWRWALWIMNGHVPSSSIWNLRSSFYNSECLYFYDKVVKQNLTLVQYCPSCKTIFLYSCWILIFWKKGSIMIFCFHCCRIYWSGNFAKFA
jgi:hypothetical protein